jgi:hypothetical protein
MTYSPTILEVDEVIGTSTTLQVPPSLLSDGLSANVKVVVKEPSNHLRGMGSFVVAGLGATVWRGTCRHT